MSDFASPPPPINATQPDRALRWQLSIRIVTLLYWGTLATLTHIPVPAGMVEFVSGWDKAIHFLAFFGLGVLVSLATLDRRTGRIPWPWLAVMFPIYSAIDEYTQGFVGRTPDVNDWLCDVAGALAGMLLMVTITRRWFHRVVN